MNYIKLHLIDYELVVQSAQCRGVNTTEIQHRYAPRVLLHVVDIRSELSVASARAFAERVWSKTRAYTLGL
jgi:hypothetical protein